MAVRMLVRLFPVRLAGRAGFEVQDPLKVPGWHSEPEPDFLVSSNPRPDAYGTEDDRPLLVVEVADTSLEYDRTTKAPLYAEAGVPEYWIINLVDDVLEVYRRPKGREYQTHEVMKPGGRVTPQAWPELEIDVADLVPSR
jgi:Uma2 family endonuclease